MTITGNNGRPQFPCPSIPEEPAQARLLGLYAQRQEGFYMQRIKILAGRLDPEQWRRLAELALEYTPGYPLHLTTRQDIELHGVRPEVVPALQRGLADAGLTTVGACGDTIRAVTVGPECGMVRGSWDLGPLAIAIHRHFQSLPGAFAMPRKFKVALSGCSHGCNRPYINDIGLVANGDGSFAAYLAGSLGPRPGVALRCYEALHIDEILPLVSAAFRLFAAGGDRKNRSRARLRHVRERLGNAVFQEQLEDLLREERTKPHPTLPALARHLGEDAPSVRLHISNGDLDPADAISLSNLAGQHGGSLRIGLEHDLHLFGITGAELPENYRNLAEKPSIMACPGAHLCRLGLIETRPLAEALQPLLAAESGLLVGVSGCPNNCAEAAVADIGLVGCLRKVDGELRMYARLLAGGGRGQYPELAEELHPAVPVEQVGSTISHLVSRWQIARDNGTGSFGEFARENKGTLADQIRELTGKSRQ